MIVKKDEDELEAGEVLVDGIVGGNKYRFLFDTGAARTCLKLDNYTEKFVCIEKHTFSGAFAQSSADLIKVPTIEIGPILRNDFAVSRGNNEESRNLIGMDILKNHNFYFSFENNLIEVDCENKVNDSFQEIYMGKKFHPYITVNFGDLETKGVWDTGAGITIVDLEFIKKHPSFFKEVDNSIGTDSTGTKNETPIFIMSDVIIGNNKFSPHRVAGVDLSFINNSTEIHMDMILGYSTLSKADWFFDFTKRMWFVAKMLE